MARKVSKSHQKLIAKRTRLRIVGGLANAKVLELLHPGSFATLINQPHDLPPFEVINCKGGRCLVRQQSWGNYVHWEVEQHRLRSA